MTITELLASAATGASGTVKKALNGKTKKLTKKAILAREASRSEVREQVLTESKLRIQHQVRQASLEQAVLNTESLIKRVEADKAKLTAELHKLDKEGALADSKLKTLLAETKAN